jgi:hypothetical protein
MDLPSMKCMYADRKMVLLICCIVSFKDAYE